MKTREIVSEEKVLGFWPFRSEVGITIKGLTHISCDICGFKNSYEYTTSIGMYTGMMHVDQALFDRAFVEVAWGHKGQVIHVCNRHKEREIDAKIEDLKEKE